MSPLLLLGVGALAGFVVLVILFILTLVLGEFRDSVDEAAERSADHADDEAAEQAFHAHGVRFG